MSKALHLIYGDDPFSMTTQLCQKVNLAQHIHHNDHVVLKPNLVTPSCASLGATTHPEIVEALIIYLKDHSIRRISIVESSWIGAKTEDAFASHNYYDLQKKYDIELVDVKKDQYVTLESDGFSIEYSKTAYEADYFINLPVLKGHLQTKMTCALKNLKGVISDRSKRDFHRWDLDSPIATLYTLKKPNAIIVDSINGDLDFEEGGNPVQTNRMFIGFDSLLVDSFGASLMGYEKDEIRHVAIAISQDPNYAPLKEGDIIKLNEDTVHTRYVPSQKVKHLEKYTVANQACSACYGNLIHALARLEERGILRDLNQKIHIGQGFKESVACGLGVGTCTKNFTRSVSGCPPTTIDILNYLKRHIEG
ncbi:MAG: DUF362 domain-containing protein [Sphaerochaetaceae bacterium]|jgi:uncharacterized protein (DUF362 family)